MSGGCTATSPPDNAHPSPPPVEKLFALPGLRRPTPARADHRDYLGRGYRPGGRIQPFLSAPGGIGDATSFLEHLISDAGVYLQ